jgi:hypothetical protein
MRGEEGEGAEVNEEDVEEEVTCDSWQKWCLTAVV